MNNIIETDFAQYCEESYLDYSMYVVLDRALPHLSDGLKPVQRRIVYAMSELNLDVLAKYKKSARTVGDVLGKFHPHGDSACYEAMVLMSQDFSYRYPLIDGQGNWGSRDDPKSYAAMRYTEARMTGYTKLLLSELRFDTVDWKPNFDGTLEEPMSLPARVPNILINGASGIAVGMSTDIPSHNLSEIIAATIAVIENPSISIEELTALIKGPDLPTQAEIISPREQLESLYATGRGNFKMRATFEVEDKNTIVITALPHIVSGEKVLEDIGALLQKKALPMIENLRDESDHESPTRLVIELKRNSGLSHDEIMEHLFAQTDLEKSYRVNMNMIGLNGRPGVKNLKDILSEWAVYRKATVTRKLNYHLNKINQRLHLIEGFLVAFDNIDRVIEIIRTSDSPKHELMQEFSLSETQAAAILEIRLRQLAKLEENKLLEEKKELLSDKKKIETILASEAKLNRYLIHDLNSVLKEFGDERKTQVVEREAARPIAAETLVSSDPVTVILSEKGWVKMGRGHNIDASTLNYKTGDGLRQAVRMTQDRPTIAISDNGKSYNLPTHQLPSARSHGDHVTKYIALKDGDRITQIHDILDKDYLLSSNIGYGFIANGEEFQAKKRGGKQLMNVGDGIILPVLPLKKTLTHVLTITKKGFTLAFPVNELPSLSKGKGNKMIHLGDGDEVSFVTLFNPEEGISLVVDGKTIKINTASLGAALGKRGRRGRQLLKESYHLLEVANKD